MKTVDLINVRKNKTLLEIAKIYLLSPLLITIALFLLKWIFTLTINDIAYGVILGLWIGVFLRFILFDLEPNYLFNINKTEKHLILDLINPIGKIQKVKVPLNELEKIELEKKTFWKAFDKIYVQKDGTVQNYRIADRNLTEQSLELI
ncbi:MAG: hypothetical protein U1C58_12720 [Flavobacteriaceae bacterium]|nr:hypothetical protein [Flavobacteriaceae bacterium]MDZ4149145.1 hypothetical protein [Flavobacteriaceae bacterium]